MKCPRRLIVPALLSVVTIGGPAAIVSCSDRSEATRDGSLIEQHDAALDGHRPDGLDGPPDARTDAPDGNQAIDAELADAAADAAAIDATAIDAAVDAMPPDTPA